MSKIVKMKRISKNSAVSLINNSKGRVFSATYQKKNGDIRNINCVRAANQLHNQLGYITVFDMQANSYRQIMANTISKVTTNGVTYKVR